MKIKDKEKDHEELAIIQRLTGRRLTGQNIDQFTQSQKWRILHISKSGQVREEIFTYPERGDHLLGVKLVVLSRLSDWMGFKSNALAFLPSYLYPLIYPTVTFLAGLTMTVVGWIRFIIDRKRRIKG